MKKTKRQNNKKTYALALAAVLSAGMLTATADRVLTVWGGGSELFSVPIAEADSIGYGATGTDFELYNTSGEKVYSASRDAVDSLVVSGEFDKSSYPAINTASGYYQLKASYSSSSKVYTIRTNGTSPYILTEQLTTDLPADSCVLAFEYRCQNGISGFRVYFGDPFTDERSQSCDDIAATGDSKDWATYRMVIADSRELYDWGKKGDRLRLNLGSKSGVTLRLRNLRILTMNDEERTAYNTARAKKREAEHIAAYLDTTYSSGIDSVGISRLTVTIKGHYGGDKEFALVEVPPYENVTEVKRFPYRTALTDKNFSVSLSRRVSREGFNYDRTLSKWAIVEVGEDSDLLVSHAHYADSVVPTYSAKAGVLKNKKGIGAVPQKDTATYFADFDSLQVGSITLNLDLRWLFTDKQTSGYTEFQYGGHTYYANPTAVNYYDGITTEAQKHGIVVLGIILIHTNSIFKDPETNGGAYAMPNMTTPEAVNLYAAALSYLAQHYSTGQHGRIHHWIMHNEVDQAATWTNMGDQPELRYNDRYNKSMRMFYNILREYDQNAYVLGSYTHYWNVPGNDLAPRNMLEQNVKFSNAEGDFKWGIAYHPYPINLFLPEYWTHDAGSATYDNDTEFVTFHNPEVIDAWVKDPAHRYKGKTKRPLFFSENGTNTLDYSEQQFKVQAAGAALIWKKVQQLDGIDAIQWHNWRDNKEEGGLRLGLHTWEEGQYKDLDPKPSWYVWKAAGTDKEDEVFAPYLDVIGLSSWDGIIHTVK